MPALSLSSSFSFPSRFLLDTSMYLHANDTRSSFSPHVHSAKMYAVYTLAALLCKFGVVSLLLQCPVFSFCFGPPRPRPPLLPLAMKNVSLFTLIALAPFVLALVINRPSGKYQMAPRITWCVPPHPHPPTIYIMLACSKRVCPSPPPPYPPPACLSLSSTRSYTTHKIPAWFRFDLFLTRFAPVVAVSLIQISA
jgi:hypothetical protein